MPVYTGQPEEFFVKITCPRCGFSRELPADRQPSKAVIATCPHCACRFRFVPGSGVSDVLSEPEEPVVDAVRPGAATDASEYSQPSDTDGAGTPIRGERKDNGDDPLPPGAIVPGRAAPRRPAEDEAREPAPRRRAEAEHAPDDDGEKNFGNLWGLLGGKGLFGPRADEDTPRPGISHGGNSKSGGSFGEEGPGGGSARFERRDDNEEAHGPASNPWETAPEPDGWISSFYQTCMRVMFGAHNFFEHIRVDTPQVRPLVFYLIVSVVQVVIERVWSGVFLSLMSPSAASDPELERMLILLSPQISLPMTVLLKTGVSVVQLYVLAALMRLAYGFISRKKTEFSLVFQVAAYSAAPALLCVVPLLGSIVGFIWMLACVLVGCRTALKLTWPQTIVGFIPVVLLLAPLLLQMMKAMQY